MSDPRLGLKTSIKDALYKVHELEATVSDFNGDQALLEGRLNGLLASLEAIHRHRDAATYDVPVELVKYVDEGGNPDTFFSGAVRSALRDNQISKGKTDAIESFRQALLEEAGKAFPEDVAAYRQLTGAPGSGAALQQAGGTTAEAKAAAASSGAATEASAEGTAAAEAAVGPNGPAAP